MHKNASSKRTRKKVHRRTRNPCQSCIVRAFLLPTRTTKPTYSMLACAASAWSASHCCFRANLFTIIRRLSWPSELHLFVGLPRRWRSTFGFGSPEAVVNFFSRVCDPISASSRNALLIDWVFNSLVGRRSSTTLGYGRYLYRIFFFWKSSSDLYKRVVSFEKF